MMTREVKIILGGRVTLCVVLPVCKYDVSLIKFACIVCFQKVLVFY